MVSNSNNICLGNRYFIDVNFDKKTIKKNSKCQKMQWKYSQALLFCIGLRYIDRSDKNGGKIYSLQKLVVIVVKKHRNLRKIQKSFAKKYLYLYLDGARFIKIVENKQNYVWIFL